jgi:hypothetical protein
MAELKVNIDFLQQPVGGDSFSYRITNNATPILEEGIPGDGIISKTFQSNQSSSTEHILGLSSDLNLIDEGLYPSSPWDFMSGFNQAVISTSVQSTGKIIVAGDFTQYRGVTCSTIVRLLTNGDLDPTFNVTLGTYSQTYTGINKILVNSKEVFPNDDDKIYVVGSHTGGLEGIKRLNPNGDVDLNAFVLGGFTGFNNQVKDIKVGIFGDIYLCGYFTTYNGTSGINGVVKLNYDGDVDPGFTSGTGFTGGFAECILESSGSVYVGGSFTSYRGTSANKFAPIKFDGTFETGFVIGSAFDGYVSDIAEFNSSIGVIGVFSTYNGTSVNQIVALSYTGSINTYSDFGTGFTGGAPVCFRTENISDFYVGGSFDSYNGVTSSNIIKLNADGSIMSSSTTHVLNGLVTCISLVDNDNIVIGGYFTNYDNSVAVQGLNIIPIGATLSSTKTNTYDNLVYFNTSTGGDTDFSFLDDTNRVVVTYTFGSGNIILVDNITDVDGFVEINFTGDGLVSPIIDMTRSPLIAGVTFSGLEDNVTFELKMYRSNYISDFPLTANYSITKGKITATQDTFIINLSPLTRDFISQDINYFYDSNTTPSIIYPTSEDESIWIAMTYFMYVDDVQTRNGTIRLLAIDGFGYPQEGVNPQPPKVMMTNDQHDMWSEGLNRLYFSIDGLEDVYYQTFEDQILTPISFTGSTLNNFEYIQQLRVDNTASDKWIEYVFSYTASQTFTKRFNIIPECKFDVVELYFKNKYGFLQTVTFFKRSDRTYNTEYKSYNRSILTNEGTFNPRLHSNKNYLVDSKESLKLNSGNVGEYMNDVFKELNLSDEIYVNDGGVIRPCLIKDGTFAPKTSLNDKIINYSITIEMSHNVINKIM